MLKFIDLKKENCSVEYALAVVEIEIESCAREGVVAIKVLHGYGSHGKGGAILVELRKALSLWKRQKNIKDFFGGDKWEVFNPQTFEILQRDKSIYGDADLGNANPGITIIELP